MYMCSALVLAHCGNEMQILIVNQWTDCFCTNGTNRQIVFARPHGFQVLMRCSLQMVYQSPEKLTIHSINQSINQSIFIPPKIKRHILSYIYSWKSKNT